MFLISEFLDYHLPLVCYQIKFISVNPLQTHKQNIYKSSTLHKVNILVFTTLPIPDFSDLTRDRRQGTWQNVLRTSLSDILITSDYPD